MLNEARLKEINAGWEKYYAASSNEQLWKEEVEEFLLANINTVFNSRQRLSVLDVGCGDGRNSFIWLAQDQQLTCLDIAKSGLVRIKEKATQRNLQMPILLAADFLSDTIIEAQYDVVQCFDALAQINDAAKSISKLCGLAKPGGYILFNYFTPGDCAYGEGERVDANTYIYKDTLFKFMSPFEVSSLLPKDVEVIKQEVKRWEDPPHGDFRPVAHTHEAVFYLLRRK